MTAAEFARKWGPGGIADGLNERAGAQPHFIDLCALLGVPSPADPNNYCFERGLWGVSGGRRFADVWMRGHFGWEYKAPGGDMKKALEQLMQYALPLENPPLLIVSDRHTIQIHTHFTGHPSVCFDVSHGELRDPRKQALLRSAFLSPRDFRPIKTTEQLTQELAGSFARIADALRARGETPFRAAHFLTQCIFCCFAESVEVLPGQVFRRVVQKRQSPAALQRGLAQLFEKMSEGGDFGADTIPWFNGGLFKQIDIPALSADEIALLAEVAGMSWASIDPSILGTLFERGLDPAKRHQMGAHYTDAATIERLVGPVVRQPLLAEWDAIKREIAGLLSKRDVLAIRAKGIPSSSSALKVRHSGIKSRSTRANKRANDLQSGFMDKLQSFRVLDPACGSGNFLFLALKALKDIEHQVNTDAEELGLERQIPVTGPQNVLGIELNEYAAELARATVWIGELQWRKEHGYGWKENPILDPLDHIECRDAVLDERDREAPWPTADVVVSNPPFMGDKKMHGELGIRYTTALRTAYQGRVPGGADLVCYWFEKARAQIEAGRLQRVGLVSTNSIRGGRNRAVMDRICATTSIFRAWSDERWVNDGAAVRVSLIGFGSGADQVLLNGLSVAKISADLAAASEDAQEVDLTRAQPLVANAGMSFSGIQKTGPFEIAGATARAWLALPNPHGRPNSEVVRPWLNGLDVARRPRDMWICDFGTEMSAIAAALFERPFAHVTEFVRPTRVGKREARTNEMYWLFQWARPTMRRAIARLPRFIATLEVGKFRSFVWIDAAYVPDKNLVVIARGDDASLGILHSRFHELWSLRMCTWMGKGNDPRYTPTTCFETFPFPDGLTPIDTAHQRTESLPGGAVIPADLVKSVRARAVSIAQAAWHLTEIRDGWLNPREWCDRIPDVVPLGMKSSPYPDRLVAKLGFEKDLAKRTLTNLYNERPQWLVQAHEALDAAAAASYGWADYTPRMSDEEILRRLLALNLERAAIQPGKQTELPLLGLVSGRAGAPAEGQNQRASRRKSAKHAA
jgi:methylase of polypeptide subunit release factors